MEKVNEYIDTGGWGSTMDRCGGAPDQLITWVLLLLRLDGMVPQM